MFCFLATIVDLSRAANEAEKQQELAEIKQLAEINKAAFTTGTLPTTVATGKEAEAHSFRTGLATFIKKCT